MLRLQPTCVWLEVAGLLAYPSKISSIPAILNVLIKMKNNGKADTTIKWFNKALTAISKHADLNEPEMVKQFIANKQATNGTKRNY